MIVFKYDNSGIPKQKIISTAKKLTKEIKTISKANYDSEYASVFVPLDENSLNIVEAAVSLKRKLKPELIVLVGIGGSNLGTKAIQEAILGKDWNLHNTPKIMYADTVDSDSLQTIINDMQYHLRQGKQVLLNAVSKSGTTTETIANFEVLYNILKRHRKEADQYVVITTDKNSKLWNLGIKKGWSLLEIPAKVGGRYSVFTPVGLFPLGMLGINIRELIEGAREQRWKCLDENTAKNPAVIGASILFLQGKKKNIYDTFLFSTDLESLGKWYRQLLAESCGKNGKGQTPTVSIGSTDLHSMAQLYLGGPNDKITNFVTAHSTNNVKLPYYPEYNSLVPSLQKKELNQIMKAIEQGTKKAYKKKKLAYTEIHMNGKTERNIGAYMQLKMIETILLGKLLGVNPFDQPAVEEYKKETKRILSS